jgi:hypothetical protein
MCKDGSKLSRERAVSQEFVSELNFVFPLHWGIEQKADVCV